jgi:hypothetical protein
MQVKDIVKYDQIMTNIIDNSSVSGIIKFKFLQMRKQFEPVIDNVNKIRDEILTKYSETNEEGQSGIFQPVRDKFSSDEEYDKAVEKFNDSIAKFNADMDPVFEEDVKIEFTKFKAADIMNAGIPSDALLAIFDLIEE